MMNVDHTHSLFRQSKVKPANITEMDYTQMKSINLGSLLASKAAQEGSRPRRNLFACMNWQVLDGYRCTGLANPQYSEQLCSIAIECAEMRARVRESARMSSWSIALANKLQLCGVALASQGVEECEMVGAHAGVHRCMQLRSVAMECENRASQVQERVHSSSSVNNNSG
jgi:hypothetical protein